MASRDKEQRDGTVRCAEIVDGRPVVTRCKERRYPRIAERGDRTVTRSTDPADYLPGHDCTEHPPPKCGVGHRSRP